MNKREKLLKKNISTLLASIEDKPISYFISLIISELQIELIVIQNIYQILSIYSKKDSIGYFLKLFTDYLNLEFLYIQEIDIEFNTSFLIFVYISGLYLIITSIFIVKMIFVKLEIKSTQKIPGIWLAFCRKFHNQIIWYYLQKWYIFIIYCLINSSSSMPIAHFVSLCTSVIIFISLNTLISIFFSTIFNHILRDRNGFGITNIADIYLTLIFKFIFHLIIFFETSVSTIWVLTILIIIYSILKEGILIMKHPYYHFKANRIAFIINGVHKALGISCIVGSFCIQLSPKNASMIFSMIFLILCPIKMKISYNNFQKVNEKTALNRQDSEINSLCNYLLLEHLFDKGYYSDFSNKKIKKNELLVFGIMKNHRCDDPNCQLYNLDYNEKSTFYEKVRENFMTFSNHIIETILAKINKLHPKSFILRVIFILALIDKKNQFLRANVLIKNEKQNLLSFREQVTLKILKSRILNGIDFTNLKSSLNINCLIECEKAHEKLNEALQKDASMHIKLWSELNEINPDLNKMVSLSDDIESSYEKIKSMWIKIETNYPYFVKPMITYTMYLQIVKNRIYEADILMGKYQQVKLKIFHSDNVQEITEKNLFSDKNITLLINGEKEKLGQIISCSSSVKDLLGYSPNDLKAKNINKIQCKFFKMRHNKFILNYYETGQTKMLNNTKLTYSKHKDGYIVPSLVHAKLLLFESNAIHFLGIIRPILDNYETILTDNDENIVGVTLGIMKKFTLRKSNIYKMKLSSFCKEYHAINEVFKQITGQNFLEKKIGSSDALYTSKPDYSDRTAPFKSDSFDMLIKKIKRPMISGARHSVDYNDDINHTSISDRIRSKLASISPNITGINNNNNTKRHLKFLDISKDITRLRHIYDQYNKEGGILSFTHKLRGDEDNTCIEIKIDYDIHIEDQIFSDQSIMRIVHLREIEENAMFDASKSSSREIKEDAENQSIYHFKNDNITLGEKSNCSRSSNSMKSILEDGSENFKIEQNEASEILEHNRSKDFSKAFPIAIEKPSNYKKYINDEPIMHQNTLIAKKNEQDELLSNSKNNLLFPNDNLLPVKSNTKFQGRTFEIKSIVDSIKNRYKSYVMRATDSKTKTQKNFLLNTKHSPNQKMMDMDDRSSLPSKLSSRRHILKKIDEAIDVPYISRSLQIKIFNLLILLLTGLITILYLENKRQESMANISNDLYIISTSNFRLLNIVEISRRSRIIFCIESGLIPRTRHANRGIKDFSATSLDQALYAGVFLIGNDSIVSKLIPNIDTNFQIQFYSYKIRLYDKATNQTTLDNFIIVDTFRGIDAIYVDVVNLHKIPISNMKNTTDLLVYLLRNCLGDLLIALEDSSTILVSHINSLILNFIEINFYVLIIFSIIGTLLFLILAFDIRKTYKKNRNVLLALIKGSIVCQEQQIQRLNLFIHFIKNKSDDEKQNLLIKETEKGLYQNQQRMMNVERDLRLSKRPVALRYQLKYFKYLIGIIFVLCLLVLIFSAGYIITKNYNEQTTSIIQRIIFSNKFLYQQTLAMTLVYEYISENATTSVRNQPITIQINQSLDVIAGLESFLKFFEDENGMLEPALEFIMTKNICTIVPAGYEKDCVVLGSGPGQQGILSLNSFVYKALMTAKMAFDSSNRSREAMIESFALWYLRDLEGLFYRAVIPGYTYLFNVVTNEFILKTKEIDDSTTSWIVLSFISSLFCTIAIWYPIQKNLLRETNLTKQTLKILPKAFLLENRSIKIFLFLTSGEILVSLKQQLAI